MNSNVDIRVVGDIFPSNSKYTEGFGTGSQYLRDHGKSLELNLKEYFKDAFINFGNLEAPLVDDDTIVNNSSFSGSTRFANTLKNLGFNIVSIANNHILEKGADGFCCTQNALSDEGIQFVGVYEDSKSNIAVFEKNELKFGFAAFNSIKDIPNPQIHAELNTDSIKKTIDQMKSSGITYKLLSFHWGNEYINIPSYEQIKFAHKIIDYGADVIIGHHPHVIQPIERYNNGLIIYSLGNFLFDFLYSKEFRLGMMVDLYFNGHKINYNVSEVQLNQNKIDIIFNSASLIQKLKKYERIMNNLLKQSEYSYKRYYSKTLKRNRLYQRIMMKIKLIEMILLSANRSFLLRNIYNHLKTLL